MTGDCQDNKANQAKEVSQGEPEINLQAEIGEYLELVPEGEIKSEKESEYQEGPIVEAVETKEIKIKEEDEDPELKL